MPYLSFVIVALFAIFMQWISYRFSVLRHQRRAKSTFYRESFITDISIKSFAKEDIDFISIIFCSLFFSLLLTGICYILIFFPLSWYSAIKIGINPIDLLLFTKLPGHLDNTILTHWLPLLMNNEARPFLYAWANLYGSIALIAVLMFVSLRRNGLINLCIIANGLLIGYYATLYLSGNLFGITYRMVYLKLSYLFLAYYIFDSVKNIFNNRARSELYRKKYEIFFNGMYGIISTFILMKGFEKNTLSIMTGPIFLICFFIGIYISERIIGGFSFAILNIPKIIEKLDTNIEGNKFFIFFRYAWQIGKNFWQVAIKYKGEKLNIDFSIENIFLNIRNGMNEFYILSTIFFIILAFFPIVVLLMFYLIGGRF